MILPSYLSPFAVDVGLLKNANYGLHKFLHIFSRNLVVHRWCGPNYLGFSFGSLEVILGRDPRDFLEVLLRKGGSWYIARKIPWLFLAVMLGKSFPL